MAVFERNWTVVRFPNGSWSTGGRPDDPEYAECWITQVPAYDRVVALRKGKAKFYREQKKAKS